MSLSVWEQDKQTFNPLANWNWADVCEYVLKYEVPYNTLHRRLLVSDKHVYALERDTHKDFTVVELEKPYFAYEEDWINAHGRMF